MKNNLYTLKFIIIGDANVGKTNILLRLYKNEFYKKQPCTIIADFINYKIKIGQILYNLKLWDTAGSEKYRSITRGYYKNADCAIIVYDITSKDSFHSVKTWIDYCKANTGNKTHFVLVGNKTDLSGMRKVEKKEGQTLANNYNIPFFESSALTGYNIEKIFADSCLIISNNISKGLYKNNNSIREISDNDTDDDDFIQRFKSIKLDDPIFERKRRKFCCVKR